MWKRGCLLVRQSFFHDDSRNFNDVGGGVTGVKGFHSSFRTTQGGLSLNMGTLSVPSFGLLLDDA
jgi:eukaryotic translation initiation factor 2C